MKVILVVDNITNIVSKIDMLKNRFGDNIIFIVKSNLVKLFATYGYNINATYNRNLATVMQVVLSRSEHEDTIICHTSIVFDKKMLNIFVQQIGQKTHLVSVMPKYSSFERMCNNVYNIYVKSIFKNQDSLVSSKLQFIPKEFMAELVHSHINNRLFEINENLCKFVYFEEKEINQSLKQKTNFSRFSLIPLIIALTITIALVLCLSFIKINYILILSFIFLYLLDGIISIIFLCKNKFDQRFLK